MKDEHQDYFYDLRRYKNEVEDMLGRNLSEKKFDKVMEYLDVFDFRFWIEDYFVLNEKTINHLLHPKTEQMEIDL